MSNDNNQLIPFKPVDYPVQEFLTNIYLDWLNNFGSTEGFAKYYGISKEAASHLLKAARDHYYMEGK